MGPDFSGDGLERVHSAGIEPERPPIQHVYAALAEDAARNDMIFDDLLSALEAGRSPLVLKVIVVANAAHRTLWNTLIAREHPHGMTTFAGRQHACLDHACSALMRHCAAVRSRLACASS